MRSAELLAVLRARLEGHVLAAPVLTVTLRAPELARHAPRPIDMLAPESKAQRALPRLVAELGAELGDDRVGTLALVDTWAPAERTKIVPFGAARATAAKGHLLVTSALEPTRLAKPGRLARDALVHVRLLARVEAVEWWRRSSSSYADGIDLASAWTRMGATRSGSGALAWVELQGEEALRRGWID